MNQIGAVSKEKQNRWELDTERRRRRLQSACDRNTKPDQKNNNRYYYFVVTKQFSKDVESLNQPRDNVPSPRSTSLIVEEEELDLMVATKSVPPPGRVSSPRVWSLGRQAGRQAAPTLLLPISILKRQLLHRKGAAWSRIKEFLLRKCKLPTPKKTLKKPHTERETHTHTQRKVCNK